MLSAKMLLSSRERLMSTLEHRGVVFVCLLCTCVFFVWMDITLYHRILRIPPAVPRINSSRTSTPHYASIDPFADLSIKVMMMDPVNHYVHTFLAQLFSKVTNFSTTFYFISPNLISFFGFLFALAATKFIISENLSMHILAVILLQIRCWFDALDGIVARERLGLVKNVSVRYTVGYVVDGIADSLGYAAFLIGTYIYLTRAILKHRSPIKDVEKDGRVLVQTWTAIGLFKVVFMFSLQVIISAILWNRYIEEYYRLLESPPPTVQYAIAQNEMLKNPITLLVIWIWRICGSHGLMQIYMAAILFNKIWDFVSFVQHIGFVVLFIAFLVSEVNLHHTGHYLRAIPTT